MIYLISDFNPLTSTYLENAIVVVLLSLNNFDLSIVDSKRHFISIITFLAPGLWLEDVS